MNSLTTRAASVFGRLNQTWEVKQCHSLTNEFAMETKKENGKAQVESNVNHGSYTLSVSASGVKNTETRSVSF